jgi:hypothetical protein
MKENFYFFFSCHYIVYLKFFLLYYIKKFASFCKLQWHRALLKCNGIKTTLGFSFKKKIYITKKNIKSKNVFT